jgi:hypothetical protein
LRSRADQAKQLETGIVGLKQPIRPSQRSTKQALNQNPASQAMPSTLILNADQNTCPALGTWISNNTKILSGFSLLIADDILQQIGTQESP